MVKREVIGAHYGVRDWLAQRITAVVMVLYTILLLVMLLRMKQFDYAHWKAMWSTPLMRYSTLVCFASLFLHAWVGMRNIFMDYIKPTSLRLVLYAGIIVLLVWYAAWAVQILWGK